MQQNISKGSMTLGKLGAWVLAPLLSLADLRKLTQFSIFPFFLLSLLRSGEYAEGSNTAIASPFFQLKWLNANPSRSISLIRSLLVWTWLCLTKFSWLCTRFLSYVGRATWIRSWHSLYILATSKRPKDQLQFQLEVKLLNHGDNMFFILMIAFLRESCFSLLASVMDLNVCVPLNS